jgi:hypothetical protein
MGVWEWLREDINQQLAAALATVNGSETEELDTITRRLARMAQLAVEGGLPVLTPSRKVQLVHAVQQPLSRPSWRRLVVQREQGASAATFDGELQIHAATTASVALRARWEENVDLLNESGPRVRRRDEVIANLQVDSDEDRLVLQPGTSFRHKLEDTKHRMIHYKAVSASRFREFFPPNAPGGFTRESDEFTINLRSTARPAPPRLLYILPTWGWERQTETNLVASRRLGNGVRVYLDRPWFSSGDGEMLAVITPSPLAGNANLTGLISQVGNDPVVLGLGDAERFDPTSGLEVPSVPVEGAPPFALRAEAFPVQFDPERKLWYCDFEYYLNGVRAEAWGGFARFSLARYQPNALPGCEVSRPVLADFVQTAPDRYAVATSDPYDRSVVRLTVAGGTLRAKHHLLGVTVPEGTSVEVSVETRRPNVEGELGWMPAPPNVAAVEQEASQPAGSGQLLWSGRITLPADRAPGQFRVMIREFEPWLDDASLAAEGISPVNRPRRLIYAEALALA